MTTISRHRPGYVPGPAFLLLMLLGLFILCLPASALAADPVTVSAKADPVEVTVGDPVTYTVSAVYEEGYHVEFASAGLNLTQFEIRDLEERGPNKLENGRMEETREYTVAIYETGEFEIKPARITYWKREDEKDILETDSLKITVKSVMGEESKDIQDIKDPVSVRPAFLKFIALGAAALLLLALATFLLAGFLRRARLRRELQPERPARREPPHITALRKLGEIDQKNLPGKGETKQFYIEVSEVIREYIWERFGVPTMERTTHEIMSDLRAGVMHGEQVDFLHGFLQDADMVKFAKYRPDAPVCAEDMKRARNIIEKTMEKAA